MRAAAGGASAVVLQGSVVDAAAAAAALDAGAADLVEMTRAQIADGELVATLRAGRPSGSGPCILCNQTCRVRDDRNPLVTCVGDPRSGYEDADPPDPDVPTADATAADPAAAGTCSSSAAGRPAWRRPGCCRRPGTASGSPSAPRLGGALRGAAAGPARERLALLADWLEAECRRLGVTVHDRHGRRPPPDWTRPGGRTAGPAGHRLPAGAAACSRGRRRRAGGHAGPGVCPAARRSCTTRSAARSAWPWPSGWPRPGGRSPSSPRTRSSARCCRSPATWPTPTSRLQRAGVRRELRSLLRAAGGGTALVEDVWTGEQRRIPCAVLVDCGHRLPDDDPVRAPARHGPGRRLRRTAHRARSRARRAPPRLWPCSSATPAARRTHERRRRVPAPVHAAADRPADACATAIVFSAHLTNYADRRPPERAARRLLRGTGGGRRGTDHHRGALHPSDRLALREADPRLPTRT